MVAGTIFGAGRERKFGQGGYSEGEACKWGLGRVIRGWGGYGGLGRGGWVRVGGSGWGGFEAGRWGGAVGGAGHA